MKLECAARSAAHSPSYWYCTMLLNVVNSCSTKVWLSGWRYRNFGEANSWNRFTPGDDQFVEHDNEQIRMVAAEQWQVRREAFRERIVEGHPKRT